jgi:WD40 repeat protein
MSSNNEGPVVQPQPLRRRIGLRFSLKTLLVAILVAALLIVWLQERGKRLEMTRLAGAQLEVCDSMATLKTALGSGAGALQVVDFDDVDTSKTDIAAFAADRYANRGITITGEGGQYAGRSSAFSNPSRSGGLLQYSPNSKPNSYAPGPTAPADAASATAGGNRTVIKFTVNGRPARVAAFGAVFIDADWPGEGPALLTVFGWDGRQIGKTQKVSGGNGSRVFRAVVVTDKDGTTLPVISRVEIINGSCWPEVNAGEGVVLDDFTYSAPVPVDPYAFAARKTAESPKTSSKAPPGRASSPPATLSPTGVLRGHTDVIMGVDFAPDGSKLVSVSRDGTLRMWDLNAEKSIYRSPPSRTRLETAIFTSDGKQMVVCGGHLRDGPNELKLCSAANGQAIHSFLGHEGRVNRVRLSPDGKLLVSSGNDKTIRVWEVSTGKNLASLRGHTHHVYGVSFHPDGKRIASSGRDNSVRVWDWSLGKQIQLFKGHTDQVIDVEFSPDGKHLASACDDKTIRFWDVATGTELRRFLGHGHDIRDICFSPDSRLLASASGDKTVKVWEVSTGTCLLTLKHEDIARTVTFSPNGMNLASACGDRTICIWDLSTFIEVKKPRPVATTVSNPRTSVLLWLPGVVLSITMIVTICVLVWHVRRNRRSETS